LQLTRVGTSQVQITPLAGTKLNGSANPVTLNNVTSGFTALMGEGNDVLELRGSTTRNFIINGAHHHQHGRRQRHRPLL
jgi:hypothetical protein